MSTKNNPVKFVKNDLDNIILKDEDGNDLDGFIRHTEYYLTDIYAFTLRVDDEEYHKTQRVFVYLRTKKDFAKYLAQLTAYINNFFPDAEVIVSGEKRKDKYFTIDLFLYE